MQESKLPKEKIDNPLPKSLEDLGVHLRDSLAEANMALKDGMLSKEQWRAFLDEIGKTWDVFKNVTGWSVDDAIKQAVDRALERGAFKK